MIKQRLQKRNIYCYTGIIFALAVVCLNLRHVRYFWNNHILQNQNPVNVNKTSSLVRLSQSFNDQEGAQIDGADLEQTFHRRIKTIQVSCTEHVRVGEVTDGGWDVCIAGRYKLQRPCVVYSFGMGAPHRCSFERDIMDKYQCNVMGYDPFTNFSDHLKNPLISLSNRGLSGTNTRVKDVGELRTFGTLLKNNGHNETIIDVLKIDIEYEEWKSFPAMFREGSLSNVKQLLMEFHTMENKLRKSSDDNYALYLLMLDGLERRGFKIWYVDPNMAGVNPFKSHDNSATFTCCYNVYLLNAKFID